ncbi:MAG: hypothetical protein ACSLE1_15340 [Sphingobium sp.]
MLVVAFLRPQRQRGYLPALQLQRNGISRFPEIHLTSQFID